MFSSHYTDSVDNRGRLRLPEPWRKELTSGIVVTRGLDRCLFIYPAETFGQIAQQMEQVSFGRADARALTRFLFAEASGDSPDKRGRISLNGALREFARLDDSAVMVGANDHIEIWNPQRFAEEDAKIQAEVTSAAERIGGLLDTRL